MNRITRICRFADSRSRAIRSASMRPDPDHVDSSLTLRGFFPILSFDTPPQPPGKESSPGANEISAPPFALAPRKLIVRKEIDRRKMVVPDWRRSQRPARELAAERGYDQLCLRIRRPLSCTPRWTGPSWM